MYKNTLMFMFAPRHKTEAASPPREQKGVPKKTLKNLPVLSF